MEKPKAKLPDVINGMPRKQYHKKYRDEHKEHLRELAKKYYKENREVLLSRQYIRYHEQGYDNRYHQYWLKNKDRVAERIGVKIECPCGGKHTHGNKTIHFKSQKHQKYVEQKAEEQKLKEDCQLPLEEPNQQ
jgi:hypothetical protein